jgi:phosphatidylinositol alpha-1,6-mannosyltransferase
VRDRDRVLLPTPALAQRITQLAREVGAELVVLDPALPVGLLGPRLSLPYGLVIHGAEVTVPGRLPVSQQLMRSVLRGAKIIVAAGGYPAFEARRAARGSLPIVVVPPGVDAGRFRPLDDAERREVRRRFGLDTEARLVVGVSRLVPRKGFDTLIRAASRLAATRPDLEVAIVGGGRDRARLERIATEQQAPVRFLGRVPDADLPSVYGAADVFAMLCRDRWAGLEQEGFGIVFLEAAACGVVQIAGHSGGSDEAVVDGVTGRVVHGDDPLAVAAALAPLLDDETLRRRMGDAARTRAIEEFDYARLAARLADALAGRLDGRP